MSPAEIQIGDLVVCITGAKGYLTLGKRYEIKNVMCGTDPYFLITDDSGEMGWWWTTHFQTEKTMKPKTKIWEVRDCFSCDGLGPTTTLGFFLDEQVAKTAAAGRGNYGQNAQVVEAGVLYDSYQAFVDDHDREKKRAAVLARLTAEERDLLGIK